MVVDFDDGSSAGYLDLWLADHDPAAIHPTSMQRQRYAMDEKDINSAHIREAKLENDGRTVRVTWKSGHASKFDAPYLSSNRYGDDEDSSLSASSGSASRHVLSTEAPKLQKSWDGDSLRNRLVRIENAAKDDDACKQAALSALLKHGVVILEGIPPNIDATEHVARSWFGGVRETVYGTMWDTSPKEESDVNDTAFTKEAIKQHTDCTYYADTPGLQIFHCSEQDVSPGCGYTLIADGLKIAEALHQRFPEAFDFFSTTPLRFRCLDEGAHLSALRTIIDIDAAGRMKQFAYNPYDLAPMTYLSDGDLEAFYRHHAALSSLTTSREFTFSIRLLPGEMMVVNNHRVLHGRTAFKGSRNMLGCYVGFDEWHSSARCAGVLQE